MALSQDRHTPATRRRRSARWRLAGLTYTACLFMALLLIVEPTIDATYIEVWCWVTALLLCTGVVLIGTTILIAGGPND